MVAGCLLCALHLWPYLCGLCISEPCKLLHLWSCCRSNAVQVLRVLWQLSAVWIQPSAAIDCNDGSCRWNSAAKYSRDRSCYPQAFLFVYVCSCDNHCPCGPQVASTSSLAGRWWRRGRVPMIPWQPRSAGALMCGVCFRVVLCQFSCFIWS